MHVVLLWTAAVWDLQLQALQHLGQAACAETPRPAHDCNGVQIACQRVPAISGQLPCLEAQSHHPLWPALGLDRPLDQPFWPDLVLEELACSVSAEAEKNGQSPGRGWSARAARSEPCQECPSG